MFPGGPNAAVSEAFEDSDQLDYYEVHSDGEFEMLAQMRSCRGGCSDPVEAVSRRNVEAVIVTGISPGSLMRFCHAGVGVFKADSSTVRVVIDSFVAGSLEEIGIDRFPTLGKTK